MFVFSRKFFKSIGLCVFLFLDIGMNFSIMKFNERNEIVIFVLIFNLLLYVMNYWD